MKIFVLVVAVVLLISGVVSTEELSSHRTKRRFPCTCADGKRGVRFYEVGCGDGYHKCGYRSYYNPTTCCSK
ncbi:uncharacterized protein LOC141906978 isoform X2 [Tubulanus polymorphus]|uniref:uncharacterized protein LOC141906978 isoform X2 n=1 Tax=Tubulanus polymorphus TaxID=672921 RepID=UPI003DA372E4